MHAHVLSSGNMQLSIKLTLSVVLSSKNCMSCCVVSLFLPTLVLFQCASFVCDIEWF